ncbi:hypothetical protein MKEN_00005700 [Mycena kentingensis (nom. inval.)]|nr:hypothetical protein MKEN_00005700 [Mycena kentingensis (nom. inval.)]
MTITSFPSSRAIAELHDLPQHPAAITAFNVLSTTGFFLLLAILLTAALSRSVYRVSTWYTYMLAWMVFCITPFPMLGHQTRLDAPPAWGTCLADAALMYASRPYAGFATLALLLQLYVTVKTRIQRTQIPRYFVPILMILPPVSWIALVLAIVITGIRNPTLVELEPGGFYCHLSSPAPAVAVASLISLVGISILTVQILTFRLLRAHWRAFRALQYPSDDAAPRDVSLSIILRVSTFALLPFVGFVLSFLTYVPRLVPRIFGPYNIVLACLPVAAALIFGSQTDVIDGWASVLRINRIGAKVATGASTEKSEISVGTFTTVNSV